MTRMELSIWRQRLALSAGALAIALSGSCSKNSTSSPSGPAPAATTITITAAGASPRTLTVPPGTQITFVNNDTVAHEMFSDPHPEHTDCPEFDSVGHLSPGATRQTQNLTTIRVCGFHDHINPFVTSLTGSIKIQ
jgi:plastocyanin